MAKSDCGLPARSGSTVRMISAEEEELNYDLALGRISKSTFYRRRRKLKKYGKIWRIR